MAEPQPIPHKGDIMSPRNLVWVFVLVCLGLGLSLPGDAQAQEAATSAASVPHLINYNGVIRNTSLEASTRVVNATFSLYNLPDGGSPVWAETQQVQLDEQGHYTVILGAASPGGVPLDLFTSGQALWLGRPISAQTIRFLAMSAVAIFASMVSFAISGAERNPRKPNCSSICPLYWR